MNPRHLPLFALSVCCVLFSGCRGKETDSGPLIFSKGVVKVFSAERIIECKARIEIEKCEYGVASIKGRADELDGDFDAIALFMSGTNTPPLDRNMSYDIVVYQRHWDEIDTSLDNRMSPKIIDKNGNATPMRGVSWLNEILIIKDGENVIFDRSTCVLHKCAMDFIHINISYGLPMMEKLDPLYKAAAKRFPNGLDFGLGGCVVSLGSEKTERAFICRQCATEYQKWQQEEYEAKKAMAAHE